MIYIKKGAEPKSLKEYRSQPNATYEDFRDKDDIREALLKEQGCLCAYCMGRISKDKMKIEHWISQKSEEGDGEKKHWIFIICWVCVQDICHRRMRIRPAIRIEEISN